MPLYDLRCPRCLRVERNVYQPAVMPEQVSCQCHDASIPMERVWLKGPPVHTFQGGFFENAADADGKVPYFDSRQKYKSYLREHGMYADYVEGR